MPASTTDIRVALAAALAPLDFQVEPWVLAKPTPPCAYVTVGAEQYDQAMGHGHHDYTFVIFVLVPLSTDVGAQKELGYMLADTGTKSVKALVEADRTLGGVVTFLWVPERTGERVYRLEDSPALGAEWTVDVKA